MEKGFGPKCQGGFESQGTGREEKKLGWGGRREKKAPEPRAGTSQIRDRRKTTTGKLWKPGFGLLKKGGLGHDHQSKKEQNFPQKRA